MLKGENNNWGMQNKQIRRIIRMSIVKRVLIIRKIISSHTEIQLSNTNNIFQRLVKITYRNTYINTEYNITIFRNCSADWRWKVSRIKRKTWIPECLSIVVTYLKHLTENIYPNIFNINEKSIDWLCECAILTAINNKAVVINDFLNVNS